MEDYPIINKKAAKQIIGSKTIRKEAKRRYHKGSRKVLKNYLGKLIALETEELFGEETDQVMSCREPSTLTGSELLCLIKESGLTGMSGNGYPVHKKLEAFIKTKSKNRILIVNGVECEPGLLHDEWILKNRWSKIRTGIAYMQQVLAFDKIILASKTEKEYHTDPVIYEQVPARYPMGEEHFLIKQILGVSLEKGEYPVDKGILVMNLQTVYQICKIINGCYDGGRFVTLASIQQGKGRVAYVKSTDSIERILNKAMGIPKATEVYAGGGIMNAHKLQKEEQFEAKIMFAAYAKKPEITAENPCKHCGKCVRKCPQGIDVRKIVSIRQKDSNADISIYQPEQCIHCGTCTYFCRASINIGELIS
ncbi:electron transport complex protein RnfC [Lachnospiraceae bacterium KM106-2]|nr:electron transport complex protein RnfC [Lachnospiraceae bacterium KM106-2]